MTRESILREAEKCVCGQRQEDYGEPVWVEVLEDGDKIRGMGDEELSEFLWEQNGSNRYWKSVCKYLEWLQQPAETEGTK